MRCFGFLTRNTLTTRNADVTFDELPSIGHWRYEEPSEATGSVDEAYDVKTSKKHPRLSFTVENADVQADEGEYQGYLVTLQATSYEWVGGEFKTIKPPSEQYAVVPEYGGEHGRLSEFKSVDLGRVSHPKIEATL